jgi:hypothetical protein
MAQAAIRRDQKYIWLEQASYRLQIFNFTVRKYQGRACEHKKTLLPGRVRCS